MAKTTEIDDEKSQRADALQDATILNDEGLAFGLPKVFLVCGVAMTVGFFFFFRNVWYLTPLFGFVLFSALYGVHANDPKGAKGWARAIGRAFTWSGGRTRGRRVFFLEERD